MPKSIGFYVQLPAYFELTWQIAHRRIVAGQAKPLADYSFTGIFTRN
jgi:hypothetical protein